MTLWYIATCCQSIQINLNFSETFSIYTKIKFSTVWLMSVCGSAEFSNLQSTHLSCSCGHLWGWCRLPDEHTVRSKRPQTFLGTARCRCVVWVLGLLGVGRALAATVASCQYWSSFLTIKWPDYCRWTVLFVERHSSVCVCLSCSISVNTFCSGRPRCRRDLWATIWIS